MTTRLGFDGGVTISHGVSDLDKAIQWYADLLGFELMYKLDDMGWCELSTHVPRVNLGLSQVERVSPEGGATITWGVSDIDKARDALESKDVRFDGETMRIEGMVALATFFDPDGNKMMLYEDLSSAGS